MPARLTAAAVERLRPGRDRTEVPDGGCAGLYLVIQPSGSRSWVFRYHRPGSKTATAKMTLGRALAGRDGGEPALGEPMTLAAAHQLVAQLRRELERGRDPSRRAPATDYASAARRYIEDHARPNTRRWEETARVLGFRPADLEPLPGGLAERWGDRDVATITGREVASLLDEAWRRGTPGIATRKGPSASRARTLHAALSGMFGWLHGRQVITSNPVNGLAKPDAAPARERVLTDDELRAIWRAAGEVGQPWCGLVRLLAATGCRLREVAEMRRDELDGEDWAIPGERTKNGRRHVLPLTPMVRELVAEVPVIAGSPFVLTTSGDTPVSGFSKVKAELDEKSGVTGWRFHDLRRTAATGMARAGADLHVIERTLNHISGSFGGIVGVYQKHKFADQVRAALEAWQELLAAIVAEKVVQLSATRVLR